ncbi:hypothetical protein J6590_033051 [Homalodisca vitripennis]|nr:hypothetical protein J6590_033051 [Homalodisca vitripennis]
MCLSHSFCHTSGAENRSGMKFHKHRLCFDVTVGGEITQSHSYIGKVKGDCSTTCKYKEAAILPTIV